MAHTTHLGKILIFNLVIFLFGTVASIHFASYNHNLRQDDIFYLWQEGQRLIQGENPYENIFVDQGRDQDQGHAIYFPLFYLLSAASQAAGFSGFDAWISLWRPVFLLFNLGIGLLIFNTLLAAKKPVAAILSVLLWWLNRYTLHGYQAAYMDFLPLFFLVAALISFPKNHWLASFLFSLSLALKQLGIFLVPLYLVWIWNLKRDDRLTRTALAGLAVASLPVLLSLPFIALNPTAFFQSILYSVNRGVYYFGTISIDGQLGWSGWLGKLPMLILMGLVYWGSLRKEIPRSFGAFLAMLTFVNFNAVLFIQHLCWVFPFGLLAIGEVKIEKSN